MRDAAGPLRNPDADSTVAAVSSSPGGGLRGVVRLSGPRAPAIARRVCAPREAAAPGAPWPTPRRLCPAWWTAEDPAPPADGAEPPPPSDRRSAIADRRSPIPNPQSSVFPARVPADLLWMPAPRSYTREDVVEIHTLGSAPLLRLLCERLIAAGARAAEPGEFTRRAFLNGRMDLAQAESVMALIQAADRAALAGAWAGLAGGLSGRRRTLERDVVALCADVEAAIDFTDQDIEVLTGPAAAGRARRLAADVEALRRAAGADATPRSGALALLYGPPNAGKSTLFNALVGAPRAIVSDVPGTTRDILEAEMEWEGLAVRLVDAAGLPAPHVASRGARDADALAMERMERLAREAELLVVVLDGSAPTPSAAEFARALEDRRGLVVANKSDLASAEPPARWAPGGDRRRLVTCSARTGEGLDRLRAALAGEARRGAAAGGAERLACTVRQAEALDRAAAALRRAAEAAEREASFEFAAADLREALNALGTVTGRVTTEDLLGAVFSRFCVGK